MNYPIETPANEWLRGLLAKHVVEVSFTKKDGTERIMLASTNPLYLPEPDVTAKKSDRNRDFLDEVIVCRDIEKGAWRSFRVDSVTTIALTGLPVLDSNDRAEVAA